MSSNAAVSPRGRLLRGSQEIADYLGDPSLAHYLKKYPDEFGLWKIGSLLCVYAADLDAILEAKIAKGAETPPCFRKEAEAAHKS